MIYHPLDGGSAAAAAHPRKWPQQYRGIAWNPRRTFVDYLEMVHELLNSEGYTGV